MDNLLNGAEVVELSLTEHRPLGCTVEESLGKKYGNLVFCSKVTPGGFAEKAGVQPGDVFLGISGMFDALEDVTSAGIERV
jgi:S1-C subfamily serine protease